jgi:putative chitinase
VSTKLLLDRVAARDTGAVGDGIAAGLDSNCPAYGIDTPLRLAHFLAQACHETAGFRYLHELWGPTPAQSRYEGRADLGNVRAGDGRLYAGRGIFQLTGRANYARIGAALGLPLEVEPELAADPSISARIACHYWKAHGINVCADADDVLAVTRKINGGTNGLASREAYLARAKEALS